MTTFAQPASFDTLSDLESGFQKKSLKTKKASAQETIVVTVSTAGHELVMETDQLSGVFQLSREQAESTSNTVVTPAGEFPVVSLFDCLQKNLGFQAKGENTERALIAVEQNGSVAMLKADSVSRPIEVPSEHVHPMPLFTHPTDSAGIVSSMININPELDDPDEALRFMFDPYAALGQRSTKKIKTSSPLNPAIKSVNSQFTSGKQRRGVGQLLAFVPNDVSQQNAEHVFSLPLAAIAEVLSTRQQVNSTLSSDFFEGFILWRTMPVPIVKLGAVFGIASETENEIDESGRRLVITRASNNRLIGFYTKSQMQTMKVPASAPGNTSSMGGKPCLGVFRTDFADMIVPDMNRILNNEF